MAMTFGKNDSERQGLEGREREKTERETNENAGDRGRFRKATERVTECQGKCHASIETSDESTAAMNEEMGQGGSQEERMMGLEPPRLNNCDRPVVGNDIKRLRKENKKRKRERKAVQQPYSQWRVHKGEGTLRNRREDDVNTYRNAMCPTGQALGHPVA